MLLEIQDVERLTIDDLKQKSIYHAKQLRKSMYTVLYDLQSEVQKDNIAIDIRCGIMERINHLEMMLLFLEQRLESAGL